jgi:hypothetical protein
MEYASAAQKCCVLAAQLREIASAVTWARANAELLDMAARYDWMEEHDSNTALHPERNLDDILRSSLTKAVMHADPITREAVEALISGATQRCRP